MRLFLTIVSILLSLTTQGIANAQESKDCPVIVVSCPDTIDQLETMVCNVTVSGHSDPTKLKFRWTSSHGKIIKGQDTASIEIETPNFPAVVYATVDITGPWPYSCPRQANASSILVISDPGPELFEKFGAISFEEEKKHLHRLALLLEKDPGTMPYIMVYAGRRAYPNEALERGTRAKKFLVGNYGIVAARVVVVDAGHRETPTVELWLVPQGANAPTANPTVDPK